MSVILFIIILGALIFVHELGHFLVAKYTGMRVDEFALGFPPNIWKKKIGGTEYQLNAIPFGGYVKIFGENPDEVSTDKDVKDSFTAKNRFQQALVLVAGVTFNVLFAWMLIFVALMSGFSSPIQLPGIETQSGVVIGKFSSESTPAEMSGLMIDDQIISLSVDDSTVEINSPDEVVEFVNVVQEGSITVNVMRDGELVMVEVTPEVTEAGPRIGTALEYKVLERVGFFSAIKQSYVFTGYLVQETFVSLMAFFGDLFTLKADMETVSGPIGIIGLVDQASEVGFAFLLVFTALISINLAIINLLPIPALDGGRLLFVAIEAIIRRPINYRFQVIINTISFSILILLMLLLTVSDVGKLF